MSKFALSGIAVGAVAIVMIGCGSSPQVSMKVARQDAKANEATVAKDEVGSLDANRKIIYNSTLDVQVKNLVDARQQLDAEMAKAKALFSKTEIVGDSGKRRVGHFVIRVPVANFQSLHAAIAALGNPIQDKTDSQDVTEEFVDLSARVKNFKTEEVVLNKLLVDAGQRLDDVFKIREQINRNRLEVERIEAKLHNLEKVTSYSTLTVTLREIEEYVAPNAPTIEETLPNYGTEASSMWNTSVSKLVYLFQVIGLGIIAITPWLPLILVAIIPTWYVAKSYRKSKVFEAEVVEEAVAVKTV